MRGDESVRPVLVVIDMVKDYFDASKGLAITRLAAPIVPAINRLAGVFRQRHWPVVFSTDAFDKDDFFFRSRMKPHALAGTPGAELIDDLERHPRDYWLPKPRMSAFFKTGLEHWLRERDVTLCAIAGVATHFCVLATALDALCHDFQAVLLEDCCMAPSLSTHEQTLATYRRNSLYPLFRVLSTRDFLAAAAGH